MHAGVQHREQVFDRPASDAGESFRQYVRPQGHRRADRAHAERLADAGGVAAQQVQLQRFERIAGNDRFRQRAETGIDAVHRTLVGRVAIDDRA